MATFFELLFLTSTACVIAGLINPAIFKKILGESVDRKKISLLFGVAAVVSLIMTGTYSNPTNQAALTSETVISNQTQPPANVEPLDKAKEPTLEAKEETKTESVAFETQNQNDPTLTQGQSKTKQEGVNGTKQIKYKVTYSDGKETSREQISETITVQPVTKIIAVGTKVQTSNSGTVGNGYTNSSGVHIDSPSSNPAGATARCGDGTYSYSQHRSGTCSHHGGVAQWL